MTFDLDLCLSPLFHQDPRFNPEYDSKTGYRTRCMVCMPVCNYDGEVIGVAQIVNKKAEDGDSEDEDGEQQFKEGDLKVSTTRPTTWAG